MRNLDFFPPGRLEAIGMADLIGTGDAVVSMASKALLSGC